MYRLLLLTIICRAISSKPVVLIYRELGGCKSGIRGVQTKFNKRETVLSKPVVPISGGSGHGGGGIDNGSGIKGERTHVNKREVEQHNAEGIDIPSLDQDLSTFRDRRDMTAEECKRLEEELKLLGFLYIICEYSAGACSCFQ